MYLRSKHFLLVLDFHRIPVDITNCQGNGWAGERRYGVCTSPLLAKSVHQTPTYRCSGVTQGSAWWLPYTFGSWGSYKLQLYTLHFSCIICANYKATSAVWRVRKVLGCALFTRTCSFSTSELDSSHDRHFHHSDRQIVAAPHTQLASWNCESLMTSPVTLPTQLFRLYRKASQLDSNGTLGYPSRLVWTLWRLLCTSLFSFAVSFGQDNLKYNILVSFE